MTWDSLRLARLPAGAKLLVTLFLLIVGPGYLFATANIYFKHRNADGDEAMTINDIRATFHGIPAEEESEEPAGTSPAPPAEPIAEPQEPEADSAAEPAETVATSTETSQSTSTGAETATVVAVNSSMLEQVALGGEMREFLEEGGEPAIRGLTAWLEAGAKQEGFEKAGLMQEGDPSAKQIIADCCISCHNSDGGDNEDLPYADTEDSEPQYDLVFVSAEPEVAEQQPEAGAETDAEDVPEAAADDSEATKPADEAEPAPQPKKTLRKAISPPSIRRLVHITHAHILAIPVFAFVVGALFMFTGFGSGVKFVLGPLPMLAVLLDIGGWWAARWFEPFIYVIAGAGALFGIAYALQILCILCSVWCGRKEEPAGAS